MFYIGIYGLKDGEEPWFGKCITLAGKRFAFVIAPILVDKSALEVHPPAIGDLLERTRELFFDGREREYADFIAFMDDMSSHPAGPFSFSMEDASEDILMKYMEVVGRIRWEFFPDWATEAMLRDFAKVFKGDDAVYKVIYYKFGDQDQARREDV